MPPDTSAPAPTESSSSKVEEQIRTAIQKDSRLQRDNIAVSVAEDRVLLSGEVSDGENRQLALRIAGDYAGTRRVVDDLRVQDAR
ncbi:MAG TPA: BON domain-containing protein [Clostridia bacterium]|nr:BON domain-containing protein [Clostridia bacterium]